MENVELDRRLRKFLYQDRLSIAWKPKTPETMKTILTAVGLTGSFWDVS